MNDYPGFQAEPLYEYTLSITRVAEYGVSMAALLAGQVPPPPAGARFDVHFEGTIAGPRIRGSVRGVDYLHTRADGRMQLHIHAEIVTDDGCAIALVADGVATGGPPVLELRENVTLWSAHPEYAWVNTIQVWAPGAVDLAQGVIRVRGFGA